MSKGGQVSQMKNKTYWKQGDYTKECTWGTLLVDQDPAHMSEYIGTQCVAEQLCKF